MTGEQATLGEWAPTVHDRRDELDDDPTPRGVVRAVLEASVCFDCEEDVPMVGVDPSDSHGEAGSGEVLGDPFGRRPVRVLDLGAGYGCWSSEMRKLAHDQGWPVHVTGVEVNPDRREHLRKWCDDVAIAPWRDGVWGPVEVEPGVWRSVLQQGNPGAWDLIIGNPPFGHVLRQGKPDGKRTDYMPVDETMVPTLLRHAPAVLLLHTAGAFDDSEHGREVWRRYPPAAVWLCGRLGFRGDSSTDSRTYYATLWLRGHDGPAQMHMLPELAAEDRRWTVPPGSESPAEAEALGLPLSPGYES